MGFLTRLRTDDNPRLHRIPFMLIWIAAYGLSWIASGLAGMLAGNFIREFTSLYTDTGIIPVVCGLVFGITLAIMQGWSLRRRYGFVPRFWRTGTIMGIFFATGLFFFVMYQYYFDTIWQAGSLWLIVFALCQTAVLFRVNRAALWLTGLAIITAITGTITELALSNVYDEYSGMQSILALFIAVVMQSVGTGIIMLRIMANPREGSVPKRDNDIKAKVRINQGMHPVTFIGFTGAAILTGWGVYFVSMLLWYLTIGDTSIGYEISAWINYNTPWLFGALMGAIIGGTSAIAQPWLMKQQSNTEVRHWIILSTVGSALAGIALLEYLDGYPDDILLLVLWFTVPALFQTIPMWRALRGGWLWLFTGIATAIVATVIHNSFGWTYSETLFAVMLGSIVQAIIAGATFVILQAQHRRTTTQSTTA